MSRTSRVNVTPCEWCHILAVTLWTFKNFSSINSADQLPQLLLHPKPVTIKQVYPQYCQVFWYRIETCPNPNNPIHHITSISHIKQCLWWLWHIAFIYSQAAKLHILHKRLWLVMCRKRDYNAAIVINWGSTYFNHDLLSKYHNHTSIDSKVYHDILKIPYKNILWYFSIFHTKSLLSILQTHSIWY